MWQPTPMQMSVLPAFYAMRAGGSVLPEDQRVLHPLGARRLIMAHDELLENASDWDSNQPMMTFYSMTRNNEFQYTLVKRNRPKGIPTAVVGGSLHAFGLAVDINIKDTMRNINEAGIDMSFEDFRQFLAGHGIIGINSEAWHYNLMLQPEYYEWPGWKLRDHLYKDAWSGLTDELKLLLLQACGAEADDLYTAAVQFQSKYSESLAVDGQPGPKTMRAAYTDWAYRNYHLVD